MPAHLEARVTPHTVMALALMASRDYRGTMRPTESPAPTPSPFFLDLPLVTTFNL